MARAADRLARVNGIGQAAYRLALRLYPESFRRRYGDELEADFADASEEALLSGGTRALLVTWASAWADLPLSLLREWLRTPWLPAMLLAAVVAVFAVYSSLYRAYGPLQRYRDRVAADAPRPPDSPELLLMMVLMVLVPVVCTIVIGGIINLTTRRRSRPPRRV